MAAGKGARAAVVDLARAAAVDLGRAAAVGSVMAEAVDLDWEEVGSPTPCRRRNTWAPFGMTTTRGRRWRLRAIGDH